MTTFDTLALIVVILSAIYSLFRGLVREVFALLSYFAAYFFALNYHVRGAEVAGRVVASPAGAKLISWLVIFFLVFITVRLVGFFVQKLIRGGGLSFLDRVGGMVLGFLKGAFILVIVLAPLEMFPDFYKKVTHNSRFAPFLKQISNKIKMSGNLPGELMDKLPKVDLDKLPKVDVEGMKEKVKQLEEIGKSSVGLDEKSSTPSAEKQTRPTMPKKGSGKPQDNITKDDQDKLNKLFESMR
jgi:membrane protein required for colicin V production